MIICRGERHLLLCCWYISGICGPPPQPPFPTSWWKETWGQRDFGGKQQLQGVPRPVGRKRGMRHQKTNTGQRGRKASHAKRHRFALGTDHRRPVISQKVHYLSIFFSTSPCRRPFPLSCKRLARTPFFFMINIGTLFCLFMRFSGALFQESL